MSPRIPDRVAMPKRDPSERVRSFEEVALGYTEEQAVAEANRCLRCKRPTCVKGCPVEIDIPGFVKLIAEGDFRGAVNRIKEKNVIRVVYEVIEVKFVV